MSFFDTLPDRQHPKDQEKNPFFTGLLMGIAFVSPFWVFAAILVLDHFFGGRR